MAREASSSSPASSQPPAFSSTPVAPVMPNSQRRKPEGGSSWLAADSQNQHDNDISPSSSATADEDIRKSDAAMSDDDAPLARHKVSNASLPSLSSGGAALMQLREQKDKQRVKDRGAETGQNGKPPPSSAANAGTAQSQVNSFHRSGSDSEDRNTLISQDEEMNEDDDDDDDVDDAEQNRRTPPSPSERDVRIMFHGREVYAEDLIGLRVAKTFAGHGRFLGQVVKFDHRTALYTAVYADGDAEDLSIDGTLQILIQDEIERADPAHMPPAISLLLKKGAGNSPASPDTGDFMHPPPGQQRRAQPRVRIQVSEREAQFVISLFENHALPSLRRQGWRVQTSAAGTGETHFVSPAGEVFLSALDVVGLIASDNELLTSCFPANVHSAILSLLPSEPPPAASGFPNAANSLASRKRPTSDSPAAEQFDGKRSRPMRDDVYGGAPVMIRGVARGGTALYRPDDLDRRAEAMSRLPAYRGQAVGGRTRIVASDRYSGGETTSEPRIQAPPDIRGYRRASTRDMSLENPFESRWSSGPQLSVEAAEYRRRFTDPPAWRDRADPYLADRSLDAHLRNRARIDGRFPHRFNARGGDVGTPTGYQYGDSMDSSPGGEASPLANGTAYPPQYAPFRTKREADYRLGEMARPSAGPRVSRETASFMSPTDTLGANAAFSMVDVDRLPQARPGSGHAEAQLRGRSPRRTEGPQVFHRRNSSGHGYHGQRGNEDRFVSEAAPEAQGEPHNMSTTSASTITTKQRK